MRFVIGWSCSTLRASVKSYSMCLLARLYLLLVLWRTCVGNVDIVYIVAFVVFILRMFIPRYRYDNDILCIPSLKCQNCFYIYFQKIILSYRASFVVQSRLFCQCWICGTNKTFSVLAGDFPPKGTLSWGFVRLYSR